MRKVKEMQMKLGEVNIADIVFDLRSRDEIPKLLLGLQYIWCTSEVREKVFEILENIVPVDTRSDTGRPGMELWKILVLGTLRLNCNWDYDKVQEMANQHSTLRQMCRATLQSSERGAACDCRYGCADLVHARQSKSGAGAGEPEGFFHFRCDAYRACAGDEK